MTQEPALVIFLGGFGASEAERLVDGARRAAVLDTLEAWGRQAVLVTDDAGLACDAPNVTIDCDPGPFHFGRRLAAVVRDHHLGVVLYMGGGSLPLMDAAGLDAIAASAASGVAVTNNLYSSDLVAFNAGGSALQVAASTGRDNSLARALKDEAGLPVEVLPRTLATQYDIDAPADLAVLAVAGLGGPRLRAYLESQDLDTARYDAVLPMFLDQAKQIVVAGRVGSHAWSYLERETACRVRLFAEERGMEADGREGAARSLLGFYLEEVGLDRFFATLSELGDAAFIDTRVLLAHKRIEASREDRFLSDLGRWQEIREPFLRDFTQAAIAAPMPVILGGHSLMSGGLMALNEHAWSLRDHGKL